MGTKQNTLAILGLLLAFGAVCVAGCDATGEPFVSETGETETGETETGETGETGEDFVPEIVAVHCDDQACIATFGPGMHSQAISECKLAALVSDGFLSPISSVWPLASCEAGAPAPESLACFSAGSLSTCYALLDGWAVQVSPACSGEGATAETWPGPCDAGEPLDGSGLLDARCDAATCSASLGNGFEGSRVRLVPECMAAGFADEPSDCAG
jgi:hypothetical protein